VVDPIEQYIYGSAAKQIQYDVFEENKILKDKRKKLKSKKMKAKMIFTLLFFFACGMLIMYRYALITDLNYESKEVTSKLNQVKNDNLTIKIRIDNALDIAAVRLAAENEYQMHKPESYQKVAVMVPKSDYIEKKEN
jgi:hypothetical protein